MDFYLEIGTFSTLIFLLVLYATFLDCARSRKIGKYYFFQ